MNKDLLRRVLDTIGRHAMIRPGDRIGIGVSGGADSVAMLRIFAKVRTRLATIGYAERKRTKTNDS
jgi:tRNA(Ile)-lysidine synthase TilS/MesJ